MTHESSSDNSTNDNSTNDNSTNSAHEHIRGQKVLVIQDDLFFSVRIESGLRKMGHFPTVIGDRQKALQWAQEQSPALAIINFASEKLLPSETTRHLKELPNPPRILGFCPHVWLPQVRPNAMASGCDLLVANSALSIRLPQLVERVLNKPANSVLEEVEE